MSEPIELEIAVRAYAESPDATPVAARDRTKRDDEPSQWSLVLDCETTIDPSQALRFGFYQVRFADQLEEEGIFYDPPLCAATEIALLERYAETHGLTLRMVRDFVDEVFLRIGFDLQGTIVGFNLPFDLARLAIRANPARGSMRGGFSFLMTRRRLRPRVRVKHLSRRASLIDFAQPGESWTPRGARGRDLATPHLRGFFVDVKTIAAALFSRSFTLAALCEQLATATRKLTADEHGARATAEYLDYARADAQATWECFVALSVEYARHGLTTPLHRIFSEASVGKAYLKDMGVRPLLKDHPETPRPLLGKIMCAYYGGRTEVRLRRVVTEVAHVDFKSMYPTVNALQGLWRFVIADGFATRDATDEARALLAAVSADDLQHPATWTGLPMLVRVRPDQDLLPVRAKYPATPDGERRDSVHTIALNELTSRRPLWYTLADGIAAKLLSGKAPAIEEAIAFEPGPPQERLKPINLFGDPRFRIDPREEDAFKRLIDLRDAAKASGDPRQLAIKIIANATSYGIFIQVDPDDAPKPEPLDLYGPDGMRRRVRTTALEQSGPFFHPILGALITGAARLMLALAEVRVLAEGLDWVFCDTDSLAIARPDRMSDGEFHARVARVRDWFVPLNPYDKPGSILQLEDVSFRLDEEGKPTGELAPLFAFAVSPKRYALFNVDAAGQPILRKASAHGLGHLLPPYTEENAPGSIAPPRVPLEGVARWQHDLWVKIVEAALAGRPDQVVLDWHPALALPAVIRYGATSPRLLRWFKVWNAGKDYAQQVKPFGFLLSFMRRTHNWESPLCEELKARPGRGRPKATSEIKPVAPYERDPAVAVSRAFDRDTGAPVDGSDLKTYAEALAQYHLSPEHKFANADHCDRGRVERRHVVATRVVLIGKESNRLEDDMPANVMGEDVTEFDRG